MTQPINNIVMISMHRSGSTFFNSRIAYGFGMHLGLKSKRDFKVRNMGELTGWGSFLTTEQRLVGMAGEAKNIKDHGGDYVSEMRRWKVEDGRLFRKMESSSIINEIESREAILKAAEWNNHVVMRIQPWIWLEMLDRLTDAALVPDAHYVVLWRRDLFAWITSLFILNRTMRHQGTIVFDSPVKFNTKATVDVLADIRGRYIESFLHTVRKLSDRTDRVTIVETSRIDEHSSLKWNDGNTLPLPGKDEVPKMGQISYVDADHNPITKEDMIRRASLVKMKQVADILTEKYDWNNAVYNAIYK